MSRIIAVCSQKGGVGKSSLTVNIGVGLARLGQKVLIVDADPQSDASASLGLRDMDESEETLSELIVKAMSDEPLPEGLFIQHQEEGVDILPSNIGLAGVEVQMINIMSREFILKQILSHVSDDYDVILIDNMPSLGMLTVNSLAVLALLPSLPYKVRWGGKKQKKFEKMKKIRARSRESDTMDSRRFQKPCLHWNQTMRRRSWDGRMI
jgi:cellulose biosynthesis protein BcsQ